MFISAETGIPAVKELPGILRDVVKGASMVPIHSAFTQSVGRPVTFFEWLEEEIAQDEGPPKLNPMLEVASLAMVSGGRVCSAATAHGMLSVPSPSVLPNDILALDYPWDAIGSGTVVDVGGGLGKASLPLRWVTDDERLVEGSMSLELARKYPDLKFVIQDRSPVLEQAVIVWQKEFPDALESRVSMMTHDFFQVNPIKGAAVYLLRHVMYVQRLVCKLTNPPSNVK